MRVNIADVTMCQSTNVVTLFLFPAIRAVRQSERKLREISQIQKSFNGIDSAGEKRATPEGSVG